MSSYKKTMREAREEMLMREAAGFELVLEGGDYKSKADAMAAAADAYAKQRDPLDEIEVYQMSSNKFEINHPMNSSGRNSIEKRGGKLIGKVGKNFKEEVELDEASKYDLYHKDFSSAMQHAYKMAKKLHGITISPDEISDKVATGPRKPSEGKTNKYRLEGDKGGIQIQVYNKGGSKPFELNMYKEEVDLDEDIATMAMAVMGLNAAALLPVLFMAVREIIRGTPLESSIKNVVDKLKKNKNYKMSDSEKSDVKGFVSKVKKEKPSLLQKVMKQAKLNLLKDEVELDEAVKVGDTVKVKLNRKGKEYIEKGKVTKIEKDSIIVKHDFSRTPSRVSMKNIVKEEVELDEEEDFKPHKMYDPKTGKSYDAKTMDDHLRMKKKGYDHEKPKDEDEDEIDESLWANIAAKRKRIKAGSGEKMRKPGEKGAPTPDQMAKAKNEELDKDDESIVKKVVGKLKKASQAHAGQSKALEKALDEQETTPTENPVVKAQNKLKVVKKVANLKQQMAAIKNEEVELDEAKMSSSQIAMLKKAYEPMRDKKIGVENADRLSKMMNKIAGDKEALMQLFKADIPFVSQSAVTKLITKHGMKGAEINKLREGHEINEVLPFVVGAAARLAAPIITRKLAATGARKLATGAVRAATGVAKTAAATAATANAAPPSDDAQQERDNARAQAERQRAADQAAQQDAAQRKAAAYGMTTEASAYSDARRAMASDPSTRQKFSKNISASDDDIKSADKNIIMQLRDVVSLKGVGKLTLKPSEEKKLKKSGSGYTKTAGSGFVEFANGRKEKVDLKIAQAILDKYNKQRKPSDKERFQAKISKSKKDMLKALKETNQIDKNRTSLSKVKNFMKENEEK